jgi:hypothetical protein
MSVLAVLAAAAREAEELISAEATLPKEVRDEADRRLKQFMVAARQMTR